ncbi:MAG: hypothetical protein M3480_06035 [Verrucomicrobiota bacterium]|nr:hypothetical protein [Chthoniobacterales bacterium]MDQ3414519.1 hypothetical protein [Verrucomicrobiota bacterium]
MSLRAALFIMLYRDGPMFRLPFALLNSLIEIDAQLATFRYRHLQSPADDRHPGRDRHLP